MAGAAAAAAAAVARGRWVRIDFSSCTAVATAEVFIPRQYAAYTPSDTCTQQTLVCVACRIMPHEKSEGGEDIICTSSSSTVVRRLDWTHSGVRHNERGREGLLECQVSHADL